MENENQANTITIDGKEHDINNFSQEQVYMVNQIKDLQTKEGNLKFQIDQVTVAKSVFTSKLIESVKEKEDPEVTVT
tara:strand:- start:2489 stop:2719 length:231 start_codon:yes stop_codon:yes gene_type:complete